LRNPSRETSTTSGTGAIWITCLLLYIAGVWLHLGAQHETQRAAARQLVRDAALATNRGTWLKEMRDLPGTEEVPLVPIDVVAVNAIVARLRGQLRPKRVNDDLTAMREPLAQDGAKVYERGLTTLGSFLGAEASTPKGPGAVTRRGCGAPPCG
jgi:hypothetical protein